MKRYAHVKNPFAFQQHPNPIESTFLQEVFLTNLSVCRLGFPH